MKKVLIVLLVLILFLSTFVIGCASVSKTQDSGITTKSNVEPSLTQESKSKAKEDISILSHSISSNNNPDPRYLNYHVVGEVKNQGSEDIAYPKVIATMYDKAGKIVCTKTTYTSIHPLKPKQTSPFEIIFYDDACLGFETYKLQISDSEVTGSKSDITAPVIPESQNDKENTGVNNVPTTKIPEKYYENTQDGVTLRIEGYTFEKKSDIYGKLKDITFSVYNLQGSAYKSPDLSVEFVDKVEEKFRIYKEVDLSEFIENQEVINRKVVVDLGVAGMNNPKEMRVKLIDYKDTIVMVWFDTNLTNGFK